MKDPRLDFVVITPAWPGDLVCARYAIDLLTRRGRSALVVPRRLAPLLAGLGGERLPYDDGPLDVRPALDGRADWQTQVYDFLRLPDSGRLCDALPGRSVGVPDRAAYDREVVWSLTPDDPTHYAVRLCRYLPERPAADRFDAEEWRRCAYPHRCPVRSARLALAPGSGRARPSKRWPMAGWRRVAAWALQSGLTPVWFLGPDEPELLPEAAAVGGEVVSGPWDEVVAAHAGCPVGLCNDTVHLHIRAHLRVRTLALFRDSRWEHWGAYPERVAGLRVTSTGGRQVEQVLAALRTIISPDEGGGPGAASGSCAPTILLETTSGGRRDANGWE